LRPGLYSGHHWGAFSAPIDPLAGFQGPLRGRGGKGEKRKEGGEERRKWEEEGRGG